MFDDIPRPTCRSVYTVSAKYLRHGGSGYETTRYPDYYRACDEKTVHSSQCYIHVVPTAQQLKS